ncbi:hypothetical protein V6N13_058810 [Hibiscus sabdariffa]
MTRGSTTTIDEEKSGDGQSRENELSLKLLGLFVVTIENMVADFLAAFLRGAAHGKLPFDCKPDGAIGLVNLNLQHASGIG